MDQVKDWSLGSELLEKIEQRGNIQDSVRKDEDNSELDDDKSALDLVIVSLEKPRWSLLIKSLLREYKSLSVDTTATAENEEKESDGKTQNRVASTSFINRLIRINLETEEEEEEEQPKESTMQIDEVAANSSETAQIIASSDMETEKTPLNDISSQPVQDSANAIDKSTDDNKESTVSIVEEKADVEMAEVSDQQSLKRKREEEENEGESRKENDGNDSENGEGSENDEDEAEEKRLSLR